MFSISGGNNARVNNIRITGGWNMPIGYKAKITYFDYWVTLPVRLIFIILST